MKRKSLLKVFVIVFTAIFFILPLTSLNAESKRVIRVGYPLMDGLSMKDEEGNYYGYDYDYLMQIAQYTGWEYEFVEVDGDINERITKLMEMLKNGEIDILGDTKYVSSLTNDYDYASEPYGSAYNVLTVPNDSDIQDFSALINKKNLKIGAYRTATKRISLLEQYAEMNGFDYDTVLYNADEEAKMYTDLDNHKVDALLTVDLSMQSGYHVVAKFSPDPFYFITTKGNTDIDNELNQALSYINKINPTLSSELYNRYFNVSSSSLVLNASEKAYIKSHKKDKLNVLIRDGVAPIQYTINKEPYGIGKDILAKLSKETGLKMNYIYADNYEEYKKLANSDEVDILLGIPYEIKIADIMNVNLSDPYLTSNLVIAAHKTVDPSNLSNKKQATTHYNYQSYDTNKNLVYYNNFEEVLNQIEEHNIDYAYVNSYLFTYYMNKYNYQNVSTFATPDYLRSQFAFGVVRSDNLDLLSILNKSIRFQESDLETYIYKNAYVEQQFNLLNLIREHMVALVITALLILVLILYFVRRYYDKQLQMKKAVELEYMRYQKLSDISGEMTFSYDYLKDEFKVSSSGLGKLTNQELIENFTKVDLNSSCDILRILHDYLLEQQDVICEHETMLLNDEKKWYQISIKIIMDTEKNKEIAVYAIGKVIDIQKEKEEHEQLRIKSETDILTGILNRGGAQEEISTALAEEQSLGALLMIDLDNFKNVNDDYGHLEGDQVLVETAKLLKSIFHDYIVARLGGDEFVIYVSNTTEAQIKQLCEETLNKVHQIPCLEQKNILLSMSIGIVFTTYSKDFITLMKRADEMLYEVKHNGRNGYIIYQ